MNTDLPEESTDAAYYQAHKDDPGEWGKIEWGKIELREPRQWGWFDLQKEIDRFLTMEIDAAELNAVLLDEEGWQDWVIETGLRPARRIIAEATSNHLPEGILRQRLSNEFGATPETDWPPVKE